MNKFDLIWYVIHEKFIWTPYEDHVNFYEFHMNKIDLISYESHKKFIWTSTYEVLNKFLSRSHKFHV